MFRKLLSVTAVLVVAAASALLVAPELSGANQIDASCESRLAQPVNVYSPTGQVQQVLPALAINPAAVARVQILSGSGNARVTYLNGASEDLPARWGPVVAEFNNAMACRPIGDPAGNTRVYP